MLKPFVCKDIIRLGKQHDGGYLVNRDDVLKSDMLLSFGVGTDISFEEDFNSFKKVRIDAYDNSVEGAFSETGFHRHIQKHVSTVDTDTTANIATILEGIPINTFLKCDIEGGEYDILDDIIRYSYKLTGAVFEFHSLASGQNLGLLADFMSKLQMRLIHTHINNYGNYNSPQGIIPTVIEVSFTSSANVELSNISLPHELDSPNNPLAPDYKINFM